MRWLARFRRRRLARVLPVGGPAFDHASIVEAINLWAHLHGAPPRFTDWSRARASRRGDKQALARMGEPGDWPTARQVERRFGSWNNALVAAGFPPRAAHRPKSTITTSL